jgi:hypothetical protein
MSGHDIKNWVANGLKVTIDGAIASGGATFYQFAFAD